MKWDFILLDMLGNFPESISKAYCFSSAFSMAGFTYISPILEVTWIKILLCCRKIFITGITMLWGFINHLSTPPTPCVYSFMYLPFLLYHLYALKSNFLEVLFESIHIFCYK